MELAASDHTFLFPVIIDGVSFVGGVTRSQHDFIFSVLALLHSSKCRSIVLEVIEGVFLWWLFYFFGKLELGQKLAVIRFSIVGGSLGLPGGPFVDVVVLGVVPPLRSGLRLSLFQALEEHVVVDLIELFLQNVLSFVNVAAETDFDKTVESFNFYLCVFVG